MNHESTSYWDHSNMGIGWNWIIISQRIVIGYYYNIPNMIIHYDYPIHGA